jgi:hypothetical protein
MRFLFLLLAAASANAVELLLQSHAAQLTSVAAVKSSVKFVGSQHCSGSRCSRRAAIATVAAFTVSTSSPVLALLPQRDFQQAKPPAAARLLPVVRIRSHIVRIAASLEDATKWEAARTELRAPDLSKANYRRVFDEYSSENWYIFMTCLL